MPQLIDLLSLIQIGFLKPKLIFIQVVNKAVHFFHTWELHHDMFLYMIVTAIPKYQITIWSSDLIFTIELAGAP